VTALPFIGSALMTILGVLHLGYTLHDFGLTPRFFSPRNKALLDEMRQTKTALAPEGRDYWSGILGFHISHSLGVLMFATLIAVATVYGIAWLKPVLVCIGLIYAATSYRCWFRVPMLGSLMATALIAIGWVV
jgi:hypothetical protein